MSEEVVKLLEAAADLLEQEGAWTQGSSARDKRGLAVFARHPDAVSFCALGAITRVSESCDYFTAASGTLRNAIEEAGIVRWNDDPERTQSEVVRALRKAASIAGGVRG